MIVNYLCWSTLISMFATLMLYPLRHHAHGARVTRAFAAIFMFPALVSSILSLIFIVRNDMMLISVAHLNTLKIEFGFQLSQNNIPIIISLNLLMSTVIFALSNRNLVNYCSIASITCFFIFILAGTPDQLVRMCALCIGTIVLTAILIADIGDESVLGILSHDFIINRLSDFLAFTSLIYVLLKLSPFITNEIDARINSLTLMPSLLFFLSLALRVVSLCITDKLNFPTITASIKLVIFYRLLISLGAQLLLLFYTTSKNPNEITANTFLWILVALLIFVVTNALLSREKVLSLNNLLNIITVANLFLILYDHKIVATYIICFLIIVYPTVSLAFPRRAPKALLNTTRFYEMLLKGFRFVTAPVRKTASVLSTMFINLINIIYSGFLLFRMPQFFLAVLQIPLRFLNNGSIERSLIFVILVVLGYAYWWGER